MAGHRASARAARNWCERLCGRAGVLCDALRCTCVCVVQWRLTLRRRIRISALSNDSFKPPLLVGIGTFHARVVPPTGPRATRRQPPPRPAPLCGSQVGGQVRHQLAVRTAEVPLKATGEGGRSTATATKPALYTADGAPIDLHSAPSARTGSGLSPRVRLTP